MLCGRLAVMSAFTGSQYCLWERNTSGRRIWLGVYGHLAAREFLVPYANCT